MRLREAYALAKQWGDTAATRRVHRRTSDAQAPAMIAPDPIPANHQPWLDENPATSASLAMQALMADLRRGESPLLALRQHLQSVREGHLQSPHEFEKLLVDALATARVSQRLALFQAAAQAFPWQDITHLLHLAGRGQWIHAVTNEQEKWLRQSPTWLDQAELLIRNCLTINPKEDADHYPAYLLGRWPNMRTLLAQYPHYLSLRCENDALAAWQHAFDADIEKERRRIAGKTRSPAEFRRPRARRPAPRAAIAAAAIFIMLVGTHFLLPSTPATPPAVIAARELQSCLKVDEDIHLPRWRPPAKRGEREKLADRARQCLSMGDWPGWRDRDPQLDSLGIADWQQLLDRSRR